MKKILRHTATLIIEILAAIVTAVFSKSLTAWSSWLLLACIVMLTLLITTTLMLMSREPRKPAVVINDSKNVVKGGIATGGGDVHIGDNKTIGL